jgi:two-component system OmpR family sensor kinase
MAGLIRDRRDRMSEEQIEEALRHVGEQGTRLHRLISDLLDLSQLEHAAAAELGAVDLRGVAAEAVTAAPPPTGRSVSLEIRDGLAVESDAGCLVRIFINLLTNAYKYGGPSITLDAELSGGSVFASVTDDGGGIPPELSAQVFEAFSRGPNSEAGSSFGLGLAIVRSLAQRAGGEIWYEPAKPHGARFVLQLRAR